MHTHILGWILALSHELFRICHHTPHQSTPENKNRKVKRCKLMSKRNPIWNVINVLSLCAVHSVAAVPNKTTTKMLHSTWGNRWQSTTTVKNIINSIRIKLYSSLDFEPNCFLMEILIANHFRLLFSLRPWTWKKMRKNQQIFWSRKKKENINTSFRF